MIARKPVKAGHGLCRIVGVITNRSELRNAARMQHPPDLFELRLDHLVEREEEVKKTIPTLRVPIIITARHPREGGANNLTIHQRRDLLLRFLPTAKYVDVELRSAKQLSSVLDLARKRKIRRILSFHDFRSTPTSGTLHAKARAAKLMGADVFKIATRTDMPAQLTRLLEFVGQQDAEMSIAAMGIGKLGAVSRVALAQSGSALIYASIGRGRVEGQLSLDHFRAALDASGNVPFAPVSFAKEYARLLRSEDRR